MPSVGIWTVCNSSRWKDGKQKQLLQPKMDRRQVTKPIYAAWNWSAEIRISMPVLLIARHRWCDELSDIRAPMLASNCARQNDANLCRIFWSSSDCEFSLHRGNNAGYLKLILDRQYRLNNGFWSLEQNYPHVFVTFDWFQDRDLLFRLVIKRSDISWCNVFAANIGR